MGTRKFFIRYLAAFAFLIVSFSSWQSYAGFKKVPFWGGQISWIDVCSGDPAVLYAGTSHGGLWISNDTGNTWKETSFWKASNSGAGMFAVKPGNPAIIVAFAEQNGRVLRSADSGATWTEIEGFYSKIRPSKMTVDLKSGFLYLAGFKTANKEGIVMVSDDFGASWDTTDFKSNTRAVTDMAISANGTIAVACPDIEASMFPKMEDATTGKIWLSSDSGSIWTEASGISKAPWKLSAAGSTIAAFLKGSSFGSGKIAVSRNNGADFTIVADSTTFGFNQNTAIAVSPGGDTLFFFGIQGNSSDAFRLYRSIWNGSAWGAFEKISGGELSGDIIVNAGRILIDNTDPSLMYIADGFEQAFLKSEDFGITWKVSNEGINAVLIYDGTKTPKGSLLALGTGSIFRSDDNAASWKRIFRSTSGGAFGAFDAGVIAAHPDSSVPCLFAVDKNGLLGSFDDGSTWNLVLDVPDGWSGSRDIVFLPSNPAIGYAAFGNANTGDSGAYLFHTTDTGHSWQATSYKGPSIQSLALCPWDSTKIWAGIGEIAFWRMKSGSPGGILEITDADPPVMTPIGLAGKIPYRLAFDMEKPGLVYACAVTDTNSTTGPLFISSDSGTTWDTLTPIRTWDETNKILDMVYSEGYLFFTTFGGIFRYVRDGNTYEQLAVSNDIGNTSCLIAGSLYAGTTTGLWKFDGQPARSIKPEPVKKSIHAAAPVFHGRNILISMKQAGNIELSVISAHGRLMGDLKRSASAGSHHVSWDEGKLTPGIYIIKIRTPEISTNTVRVKAR